MALNLARSPEESLILTVFDLVNHMTKNGEGMAAQGDLTVQQWLILLQIAGDPNFPDPEDRASDPSPATSTSVLASEIASARGVSRPNVSSLVTALLRKQLIRQAEDPLDRRRKFLAITAAGRAALERIEPVRRRANGSLFAGVDRRALETTVAVLETCLSRLWRASSRGSKDA